jgi:zinc/manganese transport system substrate-binding protein
MKRIVALLLSGFLLALPSVASAKDKLTVVTSFSILKDMIAQVGGDRVAVKALVNSDGDAHTFSPKPSDVKLLGMADVFVTNGLGFENWADKLAKSAKFKGMSIIASTGVATLPAAEGDDDDHGHHAHSDDQHGHQHGDNDPHAWQNLENGIIYVANIRDGLIAADAEHAEEYKANAARYTEKLKQLDAWVKAEIGKVPDNKRKVITTHDAFRYFGNAYGVRFLAPEGISTESQPSAKNVARIVDQIRKEHITALFFENIADKRLIEQLRRDGGATIGGTIYSDALSADAGPAASYEAMFRHNVSQLVPAMLGNPGS